MAAEKEPKAAAKPAPEAKAEGKKPEEKKKLIKGRHPSAIKRHRQNLKRAARNRALFSSVRTAVKKLTQAIVQKDKGLVETSLRTAVSELHRAASKGILHSRNASRKISRLSSQAARALLAA